jgi:ATP-dependent Lon protease
MLALAVILVAGAAAVLLAQPAGTDGNRPLPKGPGPTVTEQQEADLLRALEEKRPEEAKVLKKLKEENLREYRFALAEAYRAWQFWKDMPADVQKAHEAQVRAKVEAWRVSRDYLAATDPAQKDKLHARLQELLGQEFDADQTIREYRLGQLEEQLKRLRNELKERADRRSQVIDQSLQELLSTKVRPEVRRPLDGRPRTMPAASHPAE